MDVEHSLLGNRIVMGGKAQTNIVGIDTTLGVSYDSSSKQVTAFYFPTGNAAAVVAMRTTNVSAWPEMWLAIGAGSEYWAVGAGEVWLDNFRVYGVAISPVIGLVKAVRPTFDDLTFGRSYQLQVSSEMNQWANQGSPFTATNTSMVYPQYWDVNNWGELFFRLQVAP